MENSNYKSMKIKIIINTRKYQKYAKINSLNIYKYN
jgi:hypothetical protein